MVIVGTTAGSGVTGTGANNGADGAAAADDGAAVAIDDEGQGALLQRTSSAVKAEKSLKNYLASRAFFVENGLPTDNMDREIDALRSKLAYYVAVDA